MKILILFSLSFAILFTAGCGGDNENTSPIEDSLNGLLTAKINGDVFTTDFVSATNSGAVVGIAGSSFEGSNTTQINISGIINRTGNYSISSISGIVAIYSEAGTSGKYIGYVGTSGSLNINKFTETEIEGTFNFNGQDPQTKATVSVTEGSFKAKFK